MNNFRITQNNTKAVLKALEAQTINALEICGGKAETYAKRNLKSQGAIDTGMLRNSITHSVQSDNGVPKCYIGTNIEYAPYVELGTGIHTSGGRRTSWVYEDAKGNWHKTNGMRPRPYL